jgi:hypothetical protein
MSHRPSLQDFVDDELLRAALTMDQVVDAVIEQWRRFTPAAARMSTDPVRLLTQHRSDLVRDAVRELRARAAAEMGGPTVNRSASATAAPAKLELALIGEDEVSVDVEVSRAVELVKSSAEFELRELQAFTSALVDDINVARDTNPFRPETFVRSLWVGVGGVPMSRALQAAFMREAAEPLSRHLRQSYAAACTRLESQGVQPAAYRTIVLSVTSRGYGGNPGQATLDPQQLAELRQSMPMPLDEGPALAALSGRSMPGVDPQLVELITRLFDAMQASSRMPVAAIPLVMRLQACTMRAAVREPNMLETYDHPVWRFMDKLAFMIEVAPATEVDRCVAFARQLVDHLAADGLGTTARFEWGMGRLQAFESHLLEQGIKAAMPAIEHIRSEIDTDHQPLDVGTLDTVPAELMDNLPPPSPAPLSLKPGDRLRAYLHGDWRKLQLLWCDVANDHWLLRDIATDQTWVLRQRALDRLVAEHLARVYRPRSLVREAATRVLERLHVGA